MRWTVGGLAVLFAIALLFVSVWVWLVGGFSEPSVKIVIVVPPSFRGVAVARQDRAARPDVWIVQGSGEFSLSDPSIFTKWHSYRAEDTQGRPLELFPSRDGVIGVFVSQEGRFTRLFVGERLEAEQRGFPLDQFGARSSLK